ncbi:DNA methyltransferase [Prevotellamassilia timonensis]|uniref:class I SAM-dependent DNA methyltransferase n=1 Tax=Prevotellamassilia timonensis TaxID=1852370 RepID=UPI00307F1126
MAKKQNLSYQDIESALTVFKEKDVVAGEVGYEILKAFGKGEADIRRYRDGKGVLARYDGLLIKGLFGYKSVSTTTSLTATLEEMKQDPQVVKAAPKIVAVSDGETILAYDMRERESYENPLNRLYCDFAFFYPLCGVERFTNIDESPADVKAAEKLAKLHDELRAYNEFSSRSELHDLNIFIARLLFCFFAEDTGIFEDNLFTGSVVRYTKEDGSDLADYLGAAFNVMDMRLRNEDTLKIISQFPYVNGGLFAKHIQIPKMGFRSRKIIIECGELDWKNINPDIFGSMIQAVVDPNVRATQGMHYTSVPNIMKVINPLFLDDLQGAYNHLRDQYEQKKRQYDIGGLTDTLYNKDLKVIHKDCQKLLGRMSKMKFFDPACGSGNFLIITYKALRMLEMDILRLMRQIIPELDFFDSSVIQLKQFYGIELLDFPHEVAMLSMWLAEHQMNRKLHDDFGVNTQALPLHNITQIVCGNACRMDWKEVCPHTAEEEVFVFGNPPYLGSRNQDKEQKYDMKAVFRKDFGSLDYIACWFYKGAKYIENSKAECAFVTTNSICQGLQVALLWKRVLQNGVEVSFAHTSFKWSNNAKHNAAVTVAIVGITAHKRPKYLFTDDRVMTVDNITAYLFPGKDIFVESASMPLNKSMPQMNFGNMAADGGQLLFTTSEKDDFVSKEPESEQYFRQIYGSEELINGKDRWCLWLYGHDVSDFEDFPLIKERIDKLRAIREKSSRPQLAEIPHLFAQITQPMGVNCIVVPRHSSETREYIPMGYIDKSKLASDACMVVGTDDISIFGILTSRLHMAWVRTVGGKLETRYRYSAQLCYNTFPFPKLTAEKKQALSEAAEEVLLTRADHPEKTLAELYDPEKMPEDLRNAHHVLDDLVESCYPGYPFANDEARLECLFKLYEKMTAK